MEPSSTDSLHRESTLSEGLPDHSECLKILTLVLDGEATPEQMECFKTRLQTCGPYYDIYKVDKAIKDLVKKTCCGKQMPEDLVISIKEKIAEVAQ